MSDSQTLQLLEQLTLAEKVALLSGKGMWVTASVPRLGIPAIKVTDGPNGARGDGASGKTSACFPVGVCLASTWNKALLEKVGAAIGEEARSKNAQVLLGPTINLHRTPIGGRNFECYGEDPYLSGRLAAAFINGVQSQQVGACPKHFVCNDTEHDRHSISSEVDERTLREIYLRPFEIAVRESGPWALMSAYNRVNGSFASSSSWLLRNVLRDEWGFDGVVVSDWGAALETVENITGGLDLEMPGPSRTRGPALIDAVGAGRVDVSLVDEAAGRVLDLIRATGRFEVPEVEAEQAIDRPEHRALARQAAAEGMVLIKNAGLLPLDLNAGTVAVIGPNALRGQIQGGGSSGVTPHYQVMPLQAIEAVCDNKPRYAVGCHNHKYVPLPAKGTLTTDGVPGMRLRCYATGQSAPLTDEVIQPDYGFIGGLALRMFGSGMIDGSFSATLEADFSPRASGMHQIGLLSAGLSKLYLDDALVIDNWSGQAPGDAFFGMGSSERTDTVFLSADRKYRLRIEFESADTFITGLRFGILAEAPGDPMTEAVALARAVDVVVLVVGTNAEWETEGNDRDNLALPGQQRRLVESVIAANPNTVVVVNSGGAVEMPWLDDAAAVIQAWLPGQEFGNALVDVLTGAVNPSGRMPTTFPVRLEDTPAFAHYPGADGKTHYAEAGFVGYRWYDRHGIKPYVAFGHGLSYTQFDYSELVVELHGEVVDMQCTVRNSGARGGQEVVQVYVGAPAESVALLAARPPQELKAFDKIKLEPGEVRPVNMQLALADLAYWDTATDGWRIASGVYCVRIGASSRDIRLEASFELETTAFAGQLTP